MSENDKLAIVRRSTSDLRGYDRNARTHSDGQVEQIAASIKEFGFNNPILIDETATVIAGHGRLAGAIKLGMEQVPCIVLAHLSDAQRRAYILADNKIALNSGWDKKLLSLELDELQGKIDLDLLGFSEKELLEIIPIESTEGKTDPDEIPDAPENPVSKKGDIWLMGKHRLMCGDAASPADWNILMGGVRCLGYGPIRLITSIMATRHQL